MSCGSSAHCEGTSLVDDDATAAARFDCAKVGLACVPRAGIDETGACCAAAGCGLPLSVTCDGTKMVTCDSMVVTTYDCALEGAACEAGVCVGTGGACGPSRRPDLQQHGRDRLCRGREALDARL